MQLGSLNYLSRACRGITVQVLERIQESEFADSLLPSIDVAERAESILICYPHFYPQEEVDIVDVLINLQDAEVTRVGEVPAYEYIVDDKPKQTVVEEPLRLQHFQKLMNLMNEQGLLG